MKKLNIGVRINLNEALNNMIQLMQDKIWSKKGNKPSKEDVIKDFMLKGMYLQELAKSTRLHDSVDGIVAEEDVQINLDSEQIPDVIVHIQNLIQELNKEIEEKDSQIEDIEAELASLKQQTSMQEQSNLSKERELLDFNSALIAEKERLVTKLARLANLEEQVKDLKIENRQIRKEKEAIEKDFRKALIKGKDRDWFDYLAPLIPTITTIISTISMGKKLDNNSNLNIEFEKLISGFDNLPADKKKIIKDFVNAHGAQNTDNWK